MNHLIEWEGSESLFWRCLCTHFTVDSFEDQAGQTIATGTVSCTARSVGRTHRWIAKRGETGRWSVSAPNSKGNKSAMFCFYSVDVAIMSFIARQLEPFVQTCLDPT